MIKIMKPIKFGRPLHLAFLPYKSDFRRPDARGQEAKIRNPSTLLSHQVLTSNHLPRPGGQRPEAWTQSSGAPCTLRRSCPKLSAWANCPRFGSRRILGSAKAPCYRLYLSQTEQLQSPVGREETCSQRRALPPDQMWGSKSGQSPDLLRSNQKHQR